MRGSEIDIVVQDGPLVACILQEALHLRTNHGIDRIEGPEHHHIIGLHIGIGKVELVVRMVFIEHIVGIIVLIEKSQRDGRLAARIDIDLTVVNTILLKKTDDALPHPVAACGTDKGGGHACTPQRDDAIEHRTTGHCPYRLVISENDIQYRFANTYYFSHRV